MEEVNVANALERLDASTIRERDEALADLKHILSYNQRNPRKAVLKDSAFHKIFETIFRVASTERSNYLRSQSNVSKTVRSASSLRLSSCAAALRIAVEFGVRNIKVKTLKALIDHILESLPDARGEFCEPLALDYTKCLNEIFAYQPHVEHLPLELWEQVCTFCLEALGARTNDSEEDAALGASVAASYSSSKGDNLRSSRSNTKLPRTSQVGRPLQKNIAEELVSCLRHLTEAPSAPLLPCSHQILSVMINYLSDVHSPGKSVQDAVAVIHQTLARTTTEAVQTTLNLTEKLLRVTRALWPLRSGAVKDELLVLLVLLEYYIRHSVRALDLDVVRAEAGALLETMHNEYTKRTGKEREVLHLEDLSLRFANAAIQSGLTCQVFALRNGNPRSENAWATLRMIAFLHSLQEHRSSEEDGQAVELEPSRSRKRQRLQHWIDDTLRSCNDSQASTRLCALQCISMSAQITRLDEDSMLRVLDELSLRTADDGGLVSSWAFMALASCAAQSTARSERCIGSWKNIWQLAFRAITSASTCRSACHLLNVLISVQIAERSLLVDAIDAIASSIEFNGPSLFCDSVSALLGTVITYARLERTMASNDVSERVLTWLFRRWSPSNITERASAAHNAQIQTIDILDLVNVCIGMQPHIPMEQPFPIWGAVAQSFIVAAESRGLVQYLLLEQENEMLLFTEVSKPDHVDRSEVHMLPNATICSMVVAMCTSEVSRSIDQWQQCMSQRLNSITTDVIRVLCTLINVAECLTGGPVARNASRVDKLRSNSATLLDLVSSHLMVAIHEHGHVDAALDVFVRHPLSDLAEASQRGLHPCHCTISLCAQLSRALETRQHTQQESLGQDDDLEELEPAFETERSQGHLPGGHDAGLRRDVPSSSDISSRRAGAATYAKLLRILAGAKEAPGSSSTTSALFCQSIIALPTSHILAARAVVAHLPGLGFNMDTDDIDRLLAFLADEVLSSYEHERSEVATGLVLDFLSSVADDIGHSSAGALYELGIDMYKWYTVTALAANILSNNVQRRLSAFMLRLLQINPDYGTTDALPTPRTKLLQLLEQASVPVKYQIAGQISTVFNLFTLSVHDQLFEDLEASLPRDVEWVEGMAIRVLLLSNVGSAWPSLLRRCVYHIFETAAMVPKATAYSGHCIGRLSKTLAFGSPREVFTLFSPQLLYTWLESHALQDLPYSVFGYEELGDLLKQNAMELFAQLLVRGQDKEVTWLSVTTGISKEDLLHRTFAKSLAYAISWDICMPSSSGTKNACESRLRSLLATKEEYRDLVIRHFPKTLAQMLVSMQSNDEAVDRALEKRPAHARIVTALREMRAFSSSSRSLPETQQPSFKGKFFVDQLERLSKRTGKEVHNAIDTAAFTIVARSLLNDMHPALGPLHVCQVVRQLRLLVAISGDTALTGYPLEMLIHGLGPLAVDSQCADDAIGVLQFLYQHGKPYLTTNMPEMAGQALLTMLSIKTFLNSKRDQTTQESQYQATVARLKSFHDTMFSQLSDCQQSVPDRSRSRYLSIVQSCHDMYLPATADHGHSAAILLRELLDDAERNQQLVDEIRRKKMMTLLRQQFKGPLSSAEDLFGSDELSVRYALQIWEATHGASPSEHSEWVAWAAGVLGRAYSSTGSLELVHQIKRATSRVTFRDTKSSVAAPSKTAIVTKLRNLLMSEDRRHVGVSEKTIRAIANRFPEAEEAVEFEQLLPSHIVVALSEPDTTEQRTTLASRSGNPTITNTELLTSAAQVSPHTSFAPWVVTITLAISSWASNDPIVGALTDIISIVDGFAVEIFPFIVHLTLVREAEGDQVIRRVMSESFRQHMLSYKDNTEKCRLLLELVLYLLTRPIAQENTKIDRLRWLDIDYLLTAEAAVWCGMPTAALLFAESAHQTDHQARVSRRSSFAVSPSKLPSNELLLSIFKKVDDPDSFYGVQQSPSLKSVLERVEHEKDGLKGLMLHSAHMDASMRSAGATGPSEFQGVIGSLGVMNLSSLTYSLLSSKSAVSEYGTMSDTMLEAARKLEQWDIATPETQGSATATLYGALQGLREAQSIQKLKEQVDGALCDTLLRMRDSRSGAASVRSTMSALAVLTEIKEVASIQSQSHLTALWHRMETRQRGWDIGRSNDAQQMMSFRETIFSTLTRNKSLRDGLHLNLRDCRLVEVHALVNSSSFARRHDLIQQSLTAATYLNELVPLCREIGLEIEAAAQLEVASILWKQDEVASSIQMLQDLCFTTDLGGQSVAIGRAGILAQLGNQTAAARLEKPEDVIAKYLKPAIAQLKTTSRGSEAGRVFHEFASFCDEQLQNPGNLEDYNRLAKLRQSKIEEIRGLDALLKATNDKAERQRILRDRTKAKQWYDLDDQEYRRASKSRDEFVQQSLQNYLRALQASAEHDASVVRFFALWLEHSESEAVSLAIQGQLDQVPSWKFVVLMNQQMSRLLNDETPFQVSLSRLISRVCAEHPYHSMHHIFSSCQSRVSPGDNVAKSRNAAAQRIAQRLRAHSQVGALCKKVWDVSEAYHVLAVAKVDQSKTGRIIVKSVPAAASMERKAVSLQVPPATLDIDLRPNGDYTRVPVIVRFRTEMRIAGGISAPKVLTAIGSDGREYKQLFKGGTDDLRQDAIMEQVFAEVSKMLRHHKATRQRDLHVRTYKVLPLSHQSGIIEFVPNSIPFDDFVRPAHAKYHPGDMKASLAREKIRSAQDQTKEARVKVYRAITEKYAPVLRYFFLERFEDPDEWFERRLAYTRSTATFSMLGHILGLGDRHCHNILLDEKSGEVIHIDLGVAFEAGRVLPVPEVVPFRLTRDIVDGMGITKTEGVFRRCCEFTMEALREDRDSIMTLLNVLRYDPLYNWTVSPLRAKRMQEAQEGALVEPDKPEAGSKRRGDDAGEAGRALSIVEKKLSKTLSTAATVNELIQKATDERNLAVLFAGWAAYN